MPDEQGLSESGSPCSLCAAECRARHHPVRPGSRGDYTGRAVS